MAEASRARVTITLGRGGQVVKRSGLVSDVGFPDSLPAAGSKRSIRDRLGSNLYGSQVNHKRQKGDNCITNLANNGVDDVSIGKNDLRFKLMQKNIVGQARSDYDRKFMDLREKLSRTGQPSLSKFDTWQCMAESKESSILGRIPLTRTADDLPQMRSSRNSYSAWTLDHIRRRSPERVFGSSRGPSSPRNVEHLPNRSLSRTYDDVRTVPYMSKDVHNAPRPISSSPYMTKPALPSGSTKPVPPAPQLLGQLSSSVGVMPKSSYMGEEQQTVDGLLHSLGLGKYAILFKAEEELDIEYLKSGVVPVQCRSQLVDMTALKQMGENDLKELGIPMGPRKKILLTLLPHARRQP